MKLKVDTKDHSTNHSKYCQKLVNLIKQSDFEYDNLYTEAEYGEVMDFDSMKWVSGQLHGDLDILLETTDGDLYIEVKTNPIPQDLEKGISQQAKAAYLLDFVDYTIMLEDEEIDQLNLDKITDWLEHIQEFDPPLEELNQKDKEKTKPVQADETEEDEPVEKEEIEYDIQNEFTWESHEVNTGNLPDSWVRSRPLAI